MVDTQGIITPDDGAGFDPPADLASMALSIANRIAATMVPTGSILATGLNASPSGWLLCNGAAVSRTTYANLYAAIGTTFGDGDGSATFNLPNLKGRVIAGADGAQAIFSPIGKTGGEKEVVLKSSEIPSSGQNRIINDGAFYTGGNNAPLVAGSGTRHTYLQRNTPDAHNNLQPYMALHYMIKT